MHAPEQKTGTEGWDYVTCSDFCVHFQRKSEITFFKIHRLINSEMTENRVFSSAALKSCV